MDLYLRLFGEKDVTVFWCIDDCKIPDGKKVGDVAKNIEKSLRDFGHSGKVSIIAYGDTSVTDQGDLASSEIKIDPIYVPNEGSRRAQITNFRIFLCEWLLDHPFERPNLLMITEDMYDFITTLFRLRMDTFSILLSQPPSAKGPLLDVGYCVWSWSNLAQGGPPISEAERNLRDFINIT